MNITVHLYLPTLERNDDTGIIKLRRAAFNHSYTWHFSTQGLPAMHIAAHNRELLPHIFTFSIP